MTQILTRAAASLRQALECFDCGIDMELNNLVKDIRSLCS